MGGDHAPRAPIAGALLALAELDAAHTIQLVGQAAIIGAELDGLLYGEFEHTTDARERIEIIDASEVIAMSEKPAAAVRAKPNSSMVVGLKLQSTGDSDAFISAGNTGAQMAASTMWLKLHAGLTRPAVATLFPTKRQPIVVLDSGANVDCSAHELVQFALLGSVYAEDMLGRPNPAVALVNIGEEAKKGSKAVIEAHELLQSAGINFVGNVEGRDILAGETQRGQVDVMVCDGFVGNVLLKFYESVPGFMAELMLANGVDRETVKRALREFDYSDYGGAPLLGVRGVSIISHGASSPRALKNAVKVGVRAVETQMSEHIGRHLERVRPAVAS